MIWSFVNFMDLQMALFLNSLKIKMLHLHLKNTRDFGLARADPNPRNP
jgi:hypothetical protein